VISLTRRYRFSASHRLNSPSLTPEQNAAVYGKCNHTFGHGHDYVLEVTVEGRVDARTGMLIPVCALDNLVHSRVLRLFASRNINLDVQQFADLVPTTENMVTVIARILQDAWCDSIGNSARLRRVYLRETGRNSFETLIGQPAGLQTERVSVNAESKTI
jgi:6-pyruvoyltetrahydropterin/6-carboxytetrahydropterin synthase